MLVVAVFMLLTLGRWVVSYTNKGGREVVVVVLRRAEKLAMKRSNLFN
jgi:hypothetical protein